MSEAKFKKFLTAAVDAEVKKLLWGWGDDDPETPGLYREFDSLHARINALAIRIDNMQDKIDAFKALLAAVDAKVDEWKAKPAGVPVEVFDALAEQLKAILAKLA
jgi:hypothetical protein